MRRLQVDKICGHPLLIPFVLLTLDMPPFDFTDERFREISQGLAGRLKKIDPSVMLSPEHYSHISNITGDTITGELFHYRAESSPHCHCSTTGSITATVTINAKDEDYEKRVLEPEVGKAMLRALRPVSSYFWA